ncbi:MAG TPA: restriction endonuclease subunit S [Bacteroidales bacterium]|nr:restriction endonuclease subunit S [Bacteroidales bacterium]
MGNNTTFKPSPLGPIPSDWEVKELGEIAEFLDGKRKPIKDEDRSKIQGIYPYYGASGIIDYVNDYIFDDELILLGEDGANIINRSSPLAFKVSGKIWINNHAHVLKPINGYEIGFVTEFLESIKYDKYNTGTAQPKLNKEICSGIPVLCPPLPEQRAIATCLSTWDNAITKVQAILAQKELRKKWLMQQLLTGKKRLMGFDGEWKEVRMKDVFEKITRKNNEKNTNVVTISAQRGFVRQEDFFNKIVASEILDNYFLVEKGEFCYNKSYSNGYPWGATKRLNDFEKAVVTTLYICFCLKDENKSSGDFFEQFFEANLLDRGLTQIAHEGGRAHGLLNVTPDDFFDLKIIVPEFEEQTAIAQVLQAADKEIQLLKAKADKLKEEKKGLMQQLLTGKKRLKV